MRGLIAIAFCLTVCDPTFIAGEGGLRYIPRASLFLDRAALGL